MTAVVDASVILAVLNDEPMEAGTVDAVGGATISAVNLAEVVGKLARRGVRQAQAERVLAPFVLTVEPCSEADAYVMGQLLPVTAGIGLSLGDRACLALGMRLGLPVLTADHAWAQLADAAGLPAIRLIR